MTACRTRKSGVLSAQDCGNASSKNGERDPIDIETPRQMKVKVEAHSEAPTAKDGVPDSEVGWDCDYTAGSPNVIGVRNSCESSDCDAKPSIKQMVTGSVQCSKPGFVSFYTVVVCNYEEGKSIPSANQCRIRFYNDNKTNPAKKIAVQSLKEASLAILARGNGEGRLSDGTEATTHIIQRE